MTDHDPTDDDIQGDGETISCDEFVVFECDAIYDDEPGEQQTASSDDQIPMAP